MLLAKSFDPQNVFKMQEERFKARAVAGSNVRVNGDVDRIVHAVRGK